jgi:DNA polymerase I-like protein with 3'-5' exonuclease and polymerase domains
MPFASDLRTIMCNAMTLNVPLNVDLRSGDNWEEMKHLDVAEAVGSR